MTTVPKKPIRITCYNRKYEFPIQSLSPSARSMGEKVAELSGVSPFRLRLDPLSGAGLFR